VDHSSPVDAVEPRRNLPRPLVNRLELHRTCKVGRRERRSQVGREGESQAMAKRKYVKDAKEMVERGMEHDYACFQRFSP
jgi:hypothetical protein